MEITIKIDSNLLEKTKVFFKTEEDDKAIALGLKAYFILLEKVKVNMKEVNTDIDTILKIMKA